MTISKPNRTVVIIGGGYAGMAAAMRLAEAGVKVSIFEAGPVLGGRARRVEVNGLMLDNGQHLAIGAYRSLLSLLSQAGVAEDTVFNRVALELDIRDGTKIAMRMACPQIPAPWHTLVGLLCAEGLSWSERFAAIRAMTIARLRGWQVSPELTVAAWLAAHHQSAKLVRCLWEPLTLAALNTPISQASAQVLLNVLRDSLAGSRADSDFLLPKADLSTLFPDAAARYVRARGGDVRLGAMVKQISHDDSGWRLDRTDDSFDHLIVAMPPHRLSMLAEQHPALATATQPTADWTYQPIYTVYVQYEPSVRLPKPMFGLVGTTAQWIFDRGQLCDQAGLLAVVISAEGPHEQLAQADLAAIAIKEITAAFPSLPVPRWHKVIAEKRATFACVPSMHRPPNSTTNASLWLAGDYTAGDYPATLEGAVRSGLAAADAVLSAR